MADDGELQVGLQIAQRRREILQVIGEQAAIAQLVDRRRVDGEQQLGDVARLREREHPHVDALQVQQHAREDLRLGGVRQQPRFDPRRVAEIVVAGDRAS